MATTIDTITSPNWQMSNKTFGEVAIDGFDILMSIHNILFTMKGEVPLNPEFGSLLFKLIDLPINQVGPKMSAEVIDSISKWEKRVNVTSVNFNIGDDNSSCIFTVQMSVVGTSATLGYNFSLNTSKNNRRAFSDGFTTEAFG